LLELGASEKEKKAAEARFHKVREAFEVLNDPQRRRVRSPSYSPHHTHHTLKDCVL
jgi:hypothetical protein